MVKLVIEQLQKLGGPEVSDGGNEEEMRSHETNFARKSFPTRMQFARLTH